MIRCIIPFYNERGRVGKVVRTALSCKLIDEVVAVDDGSTDASASELMQIDDSKFKLIRHTINQGKSDALLSGLEGNQAEIIVFLDADLRGLTCSHIRSLILPIIQGDVQHTFSGREYLAFLTPLSGERAIKVSDWMQFFSAVRSGGYAFEMLMNRYSMRRKLHTLRVEWPDVKQTYKSQKSGGLLTGIAGELKAILNIMKSTGPVQFFWIHGMFWFKTRKAVDYKDVLKKR